MAKHTRDELRLWQGLPLGVKIGMTQNRIRDWLNEYGEDGVYISYSGGKDSTVLSHLVDVTRPNNEIPRVFINTGLEYPEIVQFVKNEPRLVMIKPEMNFKKVIQKFGYPFPSKEIAHDISTAKKFLQNPEAYADRKPLPVQPEGEAYKPLALIKLLGELQKDGKKSIFNSSKWYFLVNAPFNVSHQCCNVMKKAPAHKYAKETGRVPMTAQMAEESRMREKEWYRHGCNMYDAENPVSNPMAFWTQQDVLQYIKQYNIEIAPVYGDVVADNGEDLVAEGQTRIEEFCGECCKLKTTGLDRTGCMFCGFGCQHDKAGKGRFELMKKSHPKLYEWIMKPMSEGGLDYKAVLDWINENGNLNIRY